jgi:hypothetical protein
VYKELDQRYDHAKFILTRRANASVWFNSLKRHALRTGPTEFREIAYGHSMPPREEGGAHRCLSSTQSRRSTAFFGPGGRSPRSLLGGRRWMGGTMHVSEQAEAR